MITDASVDLNFTFINKPVEGGLYADNETMALTGDEVKRLKEIMEGYKASGSSEFTIKTLDELAKLETKLWEGSRCDSFDEFKNPEEMAALNYRPDGNVYLLDSDGSVGRAIPICNVGSHREDFANLFSPHSVEELLRQIDEG